MILKSTVMSEEDYKAFARPAVLDSVRRVLKFYGLDSKTEIYYNGNNDVTPLVGSFSTEEMKTDTYTDGIFRNKLFVFTEWEESNHNSGYSNQRRVMTERPVWMTEGKEGREPILFYPAFTGLNVEVGIVAGFNSKKSAEQFRRRINRATANQVVAMNFSPSGHLVVNNGIIELLKHLHSLYKKNDQTTPDFQEWFDKYKKVPFRYASDVSAKNSRVVVPIRMNEVGIYFKEAEVKLSRKANIVGMYEVEIKYSFYWKEFTGWEIEYPLNVYQDEINEIWIPRVDDEFKKPFSARVNPELAFAQAISTTRSSQNPYYTKLPEHDPWVMPGLWWVQPVIQARARIEEKEVQDIGNIFELPGFKWSELAKQYMLRRRDVVFTQFETPFLVTVWSDDLQVLPSRLSMDENGLIKLHTAPNIKNTYRVVVVLDFAVRDYSEAFWDDLYANPDDEAILPAIFPGFDWAKLPKPWCDHADEIRKGIHKGRGLAGPDFNGYMMTLGLHAHRFVERV